MRRLLPRCAAQSEQLWVLIWCQTCYLWVCSLEVQSTRWAVGCQQWKTVCTCKFLLAVHQLRKNLGEQEPSLDRRRGDLCSQQYLQWTTGHLLGAWLLYLHRNPTHSQPCRIRWGSWSLTSVSFHVALPKRYAAIDYKRRRREGIGREGVLIPLL